MLDTVRRDSLFDREAGVLRVNGAWAEPGAPGDAGESIADTLRELGGWLGERDPCRYASAVLVAPALRFP